MYNDENNLYHYTYRKDGSEISADRQSTVDEQLSGYRAGQTGTQAPVMDAKPVGDRKKRLGVKIAALALCCALVGGAAGAGITAAVNHRGGDATSIKVSGRTASEVTLKTVDGKTEMTDRENYAANVNSVVSINCSSATTNYFGQTVQTASSGTGFIITSDGYIVTNHHVIDGASGIKVTLYNGKNYDATIIGSDEDYDIAVLKIDAAGLQAVTLGDSDTLNVGDRVLAIGNPLGELTFSMSGGMVSCVNRAINVDGTPFNMIQTDASINPGNSGGPLLNVYGEVVGIVSAKYSSYSTETVEGLGFAIPINDVAAMIKDIMTNGYVTNKPYLGVTAGTMNQQMAQQTGLTEGVYVYSVTDGGAAAKAGIKVGDVITKIDDTKIASLEDLTAAKKSYSAGDQATFTIYRGGKSQKISVTWGTQPAESKTDTSTSATQNQNGNSGNSNQDMQDLFDYFFNQYGNGGSGSQGQSGTGTAA
jgi:serine protease Do